MSQTFKTSKTQNYFSNYNIVETLITASEILKLSSIAPEDKKELYKSLKETLNIKYKDLQNKDSRRLLKQLVDAKLGEMEKMKDIIKIEKKRKREDKSDKKQVEKVKEIGKAVKKEFKKQVKEKGIVGKIITELRDLDMTTAKYFVLKIEFYGNEPDKSFPITAFNKKKVIMHNAKFDLAMLEYHFDFEFSMIFAGAGQANRINGNKINENS